LRSAPATVRTLSLSQCKARRSSPFTLFFADQTGACLSEVAIQDYLVTNLQNASALVPPGTGLFLGMSEWINDPLLLLISFFLPTKKGMMRWGTWVLVNCAQQNILPLGNCWHGMLVKQSKPLRTMEGPPTLLYILSALNISISASTYYTFFEGVHLEWHVWSEPQRARQLLPGAHHNCKFLGRCTMWG